MAQQLANHSLRPGKYVTSLLALALLLTAVVVSGPPAFAHPAHASHATSAARASRALDFSNAIFLWTTTAANVSGDSTIINNSVINGDPNAVLIVSHNLAPQGTPCECLYNNRPIGVWYNTGNAKWEIFNEDLSAMAVGLNFNVAAWSAPFTDITNERLAYTDVAGTSSGSSSTDISTIMTNNNPNANVIVTPIWNPASSGTTVINDHPVGVWYHSVGGTGHWAIFNEDEAVMPTNAAFNVYVSDINGGSGWPATVLVTTSSNTLSNYTIMSTWLAMYPGLLWITPDYDPGACTNASYCNVTYTTCSGQPFCDVIFDHNVGAWYDGYDSSSGWVGDLSVFTEDDSQMPVNVAFNVLEVTA